MADTSVVGGIEYTVDINTSKLIDGERKATASMNKLGSTANKVAAAVTAAFAGITLAAFADKLVKVQRQFDILNAGLITATGSVDNAAAAFETLQKFAATTPYSIDQAVTAFTRLTNLGLDPGIKSLTAYGNTASAMGKDLMQMVEAVADASTGEFERLKEFGIRASKEGDKVSLTFKGVTETVKFSAENIQKYLLNLAETNFAGAMDQRAKTLDGAISNLADSWDQLFLTVSKSGVGEEIARGVRLATTAINELEKSVEQGRLTTYFDEALPYIEAMKLAGVSLAAVYAGKVVASLVAATQASIANSLQAARAAGAAVSLADAELAAARAEYALVQSRIALGSSTAMATAATARLNAAIAASSAANLSYLGTATGATRAVAAFNTALSAVGGWVGVAATALIAMVVYWDDIDKSIQKAIKSKRYFFSLKDEDVQKDPAGVLKDANAELAKVAADRKKLEAEKKARQADFAKASVYTGRDAGQMAADSFKAQMKELDDRERAAMQAKNKATDAIEQARADLRKSEVESYNTPSPPTPTTTSGTGGGTATTGQKFDSQGYINDLVIANADGLAKIDAQEKDALDKAKKLLNEKKLTQQEYEQAVTLIRLAASKDREEIKQKERDDLQGWLDEQLKMEEEAANKRQEAFENARATADPMAALRAEYEAKLKLFDEYQAQMLERGIVAETDQQAARTAITAEYEAQRQALAEQSFRSQSEGNAFLMDSLDSLANTATNSISGLIDGTMTGKEAMIALGRTIRDQAIDTLVQMGIQYVKNAIIAKTTTAATTAAQVAATGTVTAANIAGTTASTSAAVAGAGAIAAAAAPAAALTSVASFGTAAVVGLGALAATMVAAKAFGGGRQYGGAVNADSFYRVNETGAPEMFTASNGRQYMMPNTRGEVTPANKLGGGVSVVVNNYASGVDVSATQTSDGNVEVTVQRAVAEVASQIASNSGQVWSAIKGATNVQSKL